jgi:hypothetical protein
MKTTWDIIKTKTCINRTNKGPQLINIDGKLITNQLSIVFSNYFLSVADKIMSNIKKMRPLNYNYPIHYLHKNLKLPCSVMKPKSITPKE